MFISVDGKAKEVTEIFAGGQDGKAHKVTEAFGSVDGVAKRLYTSEKETNAFNEFTWAEIKQLANEGKLLEHFNKYDRVTIKLTGTLKQSYHYPSTTDKDSGGTSVWKDCILMQDKLILQITSLTETSMRLSSPYASVLSKVIATGTYKNDGFAPWTKSVTTTEPFADNTSITVTTVDYGSSFYWRFNDVLPEDIKAVADGYEMLRSTVTYSGGSGTVNNKEMCYVRNLSEPVNYVITQNKDTLPYTYEITETQFPRKQSAYLYHCKFPEDYKPEGHSGRPINTGRTFLYTSGSSELKREYHFCQAPRISYEWSDKYTRPGSATDILHSRLYAQQQGGTFFNGTEWWDYIPEMSISADA